MIYKLRYNNKEEADKDLLLKGIIVNDQYAKETKAIVNIGLIVDKQAVISNAQLITPATYLDGWHVDVMTDAIIQFDNEIFPNNPKHVFA